MKILKNGLLESLVVSYLVIYRNICFKIPFNYLKFYKNFSWSHPKQMNLNTKNKKIHIFQHVSPYACETEFTQYVTTWCLHRHKSVCCKTKRKNCWFIKISRKMMAANLFVCLLLCSKTCHRSSQAITQTDSISHKHIHKQLKPSNMMHVPLYDESVSVYN